MARFRPLIALLAAALAVPAAALAQGGGQAPPPTTPAPPTPAPKLEVQAPTKKRFIREGAGGRLLLGGRWYFRQDDFFVGDKQRFFAQKDLTGWSAITVPHNWNAQDTTENRSSVGWYRKEFKLPRGPRGRGWVVRFESANHRAEVWLNGKKIGGSKGGGYFPFEVQLDGLKRGRNTLVVKVSSVRSRTDLTHWRPAKYNGFGTGGWWNFGGLLREVYVRPVNTVDLEHVGAFPRVRGRRAEVTIVSRVRNLTKRGLTASVGVRIGGQSTNASVGLSGKQVREVRSRITINRPRLWSPGRPRLYNLRAAVSAGGARRGTYQASIGIRKIEAARGGILKINGRRARMNGASVVEDDPTTGGVSTIGQRSAVVARLKELGATAARSHHPLHPALMEAFDREGIMFWSQAPVYQPSNGFLSQRGIRAAAVEANRKTVLARANNPSVIVWSLANEPAENPAEGGRVGSGFATFINGAARQVRRYDRSRLIGLDRHSRIGEPIFQRVFARQLDILGVNEYFGWYNAAAPGRPPSTLADLSPFLDQVHRAYPNMPLVITEFGAEATRSGDPAQKGTYEYQQAFLQQHLPVHQSKSFVNGSIHWALKDFRVNDQWTGGNDPAYATIPWHNKSVIEENGTKKPAFSTLAGFFRRRGKR